MPRKPLRPCAVPGCPRPAVGGSRCEEHAMLRPARPYVPGERPSPFAQGYNTEWRKISKEFLRRYPWCMEPGCCEPATEVHHVDGDRHNNSWDNLMAMCKSHHSRLTARRRRGGGRGDKISGAKKQ